MRGTVQLTNSQGGSMPKISYYFKRRRSICRITITLVHYGSEVCTGELTKRGSLLNTSEKILEKIKGRQVTVIERKHWDI